MQVHVIGELQKRGVSALYLSYGTEMKRRDVQTVEEIEKHQQDCIAFLNKKSSGDLSKDPLGLLAS